VRDLRGVTPWDVITLGMRKENYPRGNRSPERGDRQGDEATPMMMSPESEVVLLSSNSKRGCPLWIPAQDKGI